MDRSPGKHELQIWLYMASIEKLRNEVVICTCQHRIEGPFISFAITKLPLRNSRGTMIILNEILYLE